MTLGQLKKETMVLIEEYNGTGTYTNDADLAAKLNFAVNTIQTELALDVSPIIKKEVIAKSSTANLEHSLPTDFYQLYRIEECSWDVIGDKINFNNEYIGNINMYYKAYPTRIIDTTIDATELQLDRNAQEIMKWGIASEILKVDPSIDYGIFEAKYQNLKANISASRNGGIMQVVRMQPGKDFF